jgi:hypothetical protein
MAWFMVTAETHRTAKANLELRNSGKRQRPGKDRAAKKRKRRKGKLMRAIVILAFFVLALLAPFCGLLIIA